MGESPYAEEEEEEEDEEEEGKVLPEQNQSGIDGDAISWHG